MNKLSLTCMDERRRQAVRDKELNGIDYIEVIDRKDEKTNEVKVYLCIHLFGKGLEEIDKTNVCIVGGRRICNIQVEKVDIEHVDDPEVEDCLRVWLNKAGDFSTYTLSLVKVKKGQQTNEPLDGFDPRYSKIDFNFRVACPSSLDCKEVRACNQKRSIEPEINYLAKDYSSFRQIILDRLALIMPNWNENHIPDIGVSLVEVLAYVGDYLSYYQDAVATEAYIDTARQRISVRRHAKLVDYQMHEGCNSRTWISIESDSDFSLDPKDVYFITKCDELSQFPGNILRGIDLVNVPASHYKVFEPIVDNFDKPIQFYTAHSTLKFYTWGDLKCCLPIGTTQATLRDEWARMESTDQQASSDSQTPKSQSGTGSFSHERERKLHLKPGDIIIFEEVIGPNTGNPADIDINHRQAVRLTKVEPGEDRLYSPPVPVLEIEWETKDALTFPLCISSVLPSPDCSLVEDISVARGNVILVDHGKTVYPSEPLGIVHQDALIGKCSCQGVPDVIYQPAVFNPVLKNQPVTFSQPIDFSLSASEMLSQNPRKALPQIVLTGLPATHGEPIDPTDQRWKWHPKFDLLDSDSQARDFVAEIDNGGWSHLRFGDGEIGKTPDANTIFNADYRVGNGSDGNIGADTINFIVFQKTTLTGVALRPRNLLPASGGTQPEPMEEVRLFAPQAFRKELQRAITADDYAALAEKHRQVQDASATLSWTGSWYEAKVAIDPFGKEELDSELQQNIEGYLYRYRRMGHDLAVVPAIYIPLDLELDVCVLPDYLQGHVEADLLDLFSNQIMANGMPGFFHPDNLVFGEGIAVSKIISAAQGVSGVQNVSAKLKRFGESDDYAISDGILSLQPMEVAELDNDPSFPEHGKLTVNMEGGR